MYFEGYVAEKEAMRQYANLPKDAGCAGCPAARIPPGVPLPPFNYQYLPVGDFSRRQRDIDSIWAGV